MENFEIDGNTRFDLILRFDLLRNLYAGQEATVRTGHGTTEWFQIGKGVWQGYILSPCYFTLYIRHHNSISFADSHNHEEKMQSIPHYEVILGQHSKSILRENNVEMSEIHWHTIEKHRQSLKIVGS